jgi:hypothetical protein
MPTVGANVWARRIASGDRDKAPPLISAVVLSQGKDGLFFRVVDGCWSLRDWYDRACREVQADGRTIIAAIKA